VVAGQCTRTASVSFSIRSCTAVIVTFALTLVVSSCRQQQTTDRTTSPAYYTAQQYGGAHVGGTATGDTQAGAAFARWVFEQDPQHQYITNAIVRGNNSLGVKVQPRTTKGNVEKLLVSLLAGMAKTFPGKPLTAVTFYQSGDKLAEAQFDPQSSRVNVQFAQ